MNTFIQQVTLKISIIAVLLNLIFIKKSWKTLNSFHKNIKQQLILTIIIRNIYLLSRKSTY